MPQEYDIVVVGAGLIGSAAARHLVEISKDVKVLLIGPEEPKVKKISNKFRHLLCFNANGRNNFN